MYNPNIPNINEVGHYKKINVTELRQMPEDELIRFFVNIYGKEFTERMKVMTKDEQKEVNDFIDNIPKNIFNEIMKGMDKKDHDVKQQLTQQLNSTPNKINNTINIGKQTLNEADALMHDMNAFIDEYK